MKRAYVNFNLLNGKEDMEVIPNSVLLLEDEKIIGVGQNLNTEGYEVVDLKGKYLMPGLINLHVHLPGSGKPEKKAKDKRPLVKFIKSTKLGHLIGEKLTASYAKMELLSGVTTLRSVGGVYDLDGVVRNKINKGKYLGPRLVVCNEALTVEGGHMEGTVAYGAETLRDMRKHIDKLIEQGADWIKIMITGGVLDAKKKGEPGEMRMTRDQVEFCVNYAHSKGKKVCAHIESQAGISLAADLDVDTIEHGAFVDAETIKDMVNNECTVIITISPAVNLLYCDESSKNSDIIMENGKVIMDGMIQCAKECFKHNIRIGLGTDTGCPYTTHYDTWRELEYFHHYLGLSRAEALHIATEVNAQIIGFDYDTGTIEEGKSADFIVSKKNPLDNFDALKNLEMISMKGKVINNPKIDKNEDVEKAVDNFYYNILPKE